MRVLVHKAHLGKKMVTVVPGRAVRLPPVQVQASTKEALLAGVTDAVNAVYAERARRDVGPRPT